MAKKKNCKKNFVRIASIVILGLSIVGFAYASETIGKKANGIIGQDEPTVNNAIVTTTPSETPTIVQTPIPTQVEAVVIPTAALSSKEVVYLPHLGKTSECDTRGSTATQKASQTIYDYQQDQVECVRNKSADVTNCAASCQKYYLNFDSTICTSSGTNEEVNACLTNISNGWQKCTDRCKSLLNVCTVNLPQTYKDNFDSLYNQYCQ